MCDTILCFKRMRSIGYLKKIKIKLYAPKYPSPSKHKDNFTDSHGFIPLFSACSAINFKGQLQTTIAPTGKALFENKLSDGYSVSILFLWHTLNMQTNCIVKLLGM